MSEIWGENNSFLKDIKADECMKTQLRTRAREHTTDALIVSLSHMLHISVINICSLIVTYLQIYYLSRAPHLQMTVFTYRPPPALRPLIAQIEMQIGSF